MVRSKERCYRRIYIFKQAINKATTSIDYCTLSTNYCHDQEKYVYR
jgi:hypothetical protein